MPEEEVVVEVELEPLFELLDPLEELELEVVLDVVLELDPVLVVLLAVGVEVEVLSVPVEEEPDEPEVVELELPELELDPEDELLVCVAFGTVAATASEPAIPLTATIAVIVAVRALPCRTERAAPSASMA